MVREITIGQYYPVDSILHKLDPRVKIVCTLIFLISLVCSEQCDRIFAGNHFSGGSDCHCQKCRHPLIIRGLKPVLILLLFTGVMNLFFTTGRCRAGCISGSSRSQKKDFAPRYIWSIRLIYLIAGSSLMTFTTTPNALTDGIETLLNPLNKIRVPVHEIAMIMSIALRFIPILLEETDKIMKAQIARGADLESGNMIQKMKSMVPILVPLFVSAFRRANDLAMAMESRCYRGGEGRTKMKPLVYESRDRAAYAITILFFIAMAAGGRILPIHLWIF